MKSCIHLLRCVSVGLAVNSDSLHPNTPHSLATLIQHILSCNLKGIMTFKVDCGSCNFILEAVATSKFYPLQHFMWATFGFIRSIVTANKVGSAFCTPKWTNLIIEIMDSFTSSSDALLPTLSSHKKITQQVSKV